MNWNITYNEQNALVEVTVSGTIVADKTAKMAIQGIKFARERDCRKFLINYTQANVGDSTMDTYRFMKGLETLGITRSDSIAIVYAKNKKEHLFAETVAVNRSWLNIQYFFNLEAATNWLIDR